MPLVKQLGAGARMDLKKTRIYPRKVPGFWRLHIPLETVLHWWIRFCWWKFPPVTIVCPANMVPCICDKGDVGNDNGCGGAEASCGHVSLPWIGGNPSASGLGCDGRTWGHSLHRWAGSVWKSWSSTWSFVAKCTMPGLIDNMPSVFISRLPMSSWNEHKYGNDIFFELNRRGAVVYELEDNGNEFRRKICDRLVIDAIFRTGRGTVGLLVVLIVNLSRQ